MLLKSLYFIRCQISHNLRLPCILQQQFFHMGKPLAHRWTLSEYRKGAPKRDDGTAGLPVDFYGEKVIDYPSVDTPTTLFNGIPYESLPRLSITCTKNNTKLSLWDSKNTPMGKKSCYTEGFKGSKKGTTVAAQAAALAMCKLLKLLDTTTVKVIMRGLGPGRMPSIQVLEKQGINVVSITDTTDYVVTKTARPKKARRT